LATVKEILKEIYLMPELKLVEKKLEETVTSKSSLMTNFTGQMLKGGKRLRPLLIILSASFYPHSTISLVEAAAAAELIHTASLVHDDIIDKSFQRRGMPTINSEWGNHTAVLTGDFLFAKSFELLTKNKEYEILELMTYTISLMCEGEIEQAHKTWDCTKTENDYLEQIYKKTSFFISACCQAGGILCSMPHEELRHLADYGLHLGYAYQMTDDMLDFSSSPLTGKPEENDLIQGNLNLPLLFLIKHPSYGERIKGIIQNRDLNPENMEFVRAAVHECGALEYTYQKSKERVMRAKANLQYLPPAPAKKVLLNLADYIINRKR